jgi:DNA-binding CsgD family transcriptional regulator
MLDWPVSIASHHFARNPAQPRRAPGLRRLTRRESQVLQLIGEGKRSKQIGAILRIELATVEKHRSRIRTKLGIEGRMGLLRFAIANRFYQTHARFETVVLELSD